MTQKFRNPREVDTRDSGDWWQADLMYKIETARKAARKAGKTLTEAQGKQIVKDHWAEAAREDEAKRAAKKAAAGKKKPAAKKK